MMSCLCSDMESFKMTGTDAHIIQALQSLGLIYCLTSSSLPLPPALTLSLVINEQFPAELEEKKTESGFWIIFTNSAVSRFELGPAALNRSRPVQENI